MQERRKYARLTIPLEVNYTIEGKEGTQYKTIAKNISPNGAMLSIEGELSKSAILDLEIKIPDSSKPIPIKAKVVWSKKGPEEGKDAYNTGLEFVQIPEESKNTFFQYLCNLMYDQLKRIK